MKINVMLSESAAFTPAQMKKLVKDAKITVLSVRTKPGVLIKPGATIPPGLREVGKNILTITDLETNTKGAIKSVTLSGRGLVKAAALQKLLEAPVPKKTDRIGTESMRFSTASDLASAGVSGTKQTAAQKANIGSKKTSNAKIGDNAKLAAIAEELRTLNIRRKALEDQYIKLKKKLDPKAYRNVKDDSSLKRRANRKRA